MKAIALNTIWRRRNGEREVIDAGAEFDCGVTEFEEYKAVGAARASEIEQPELPFEPALVDDNLPQLSAAIADLETPADAADDPYTAPVADFKAKGEPAAISPAFAKFDHDGDGKPGGSLPKAKRGPKKKGRKAADTNDDLI